MVGIAFNPTFHGGNYYARAAPLMEKLAELDMFVQIQSEHELLLMFVPWIEQIPVRVLIDHCGRPTVEAGLDQPGFQGLLKLAETGRVYVKLSGYAKFARSAYPFEDAWPYVRGARRCVHPGTLHLGVGLAISARHGAAGLRPAGETGRDAVSRSGRSPHSLLGNTAPPVRLRRQTSRRHSARPSRQPPLDGHCTC